MQGSDLINRIKILVDSPSDLSLKKAEENGIFVMPVKFSMGDEEELIRDKYDITEDEFYSKIRETGIIPRTVQITPYDFEEYFRMFADDFDDLIVITISKNGSGTYKNACMAKKAVEEEKAVEIHIVNSNMFAYGYGDGALKAARMAKEGKTAEEIVSFLEDKFKTTHTYFAVETLEYLKKGGRITTLSAMIGGILDIRPILRMNEDGLVGAFEKVKGEKKLYSKMADIIKADVSARKEYELYLLWSDRKEKIDKMRELLENEGIKITGEERIGSVIGCHAGPGVFGITIFDK